MADPKNKWSQPAAPPAPMFFGKKERELVKQVNDELAERVIGQAVAYYPISLEESNFNTTYGEAVEKVSLPPIRVYAYVVVENEQSNEKYGYEYTNKLTVNFHRARLTADQDLYVRVGDYLQYGEKFYEIVKTYNDTRYLFGQVEHKFQISAECIEARPGAFRVEKALTRPTALSGSSADTSAPAPRPAPYPPLAATYITVTADPKLPNERVLTAGAGITLTDLGAGSTITIASTSGGGGIFTPVDASNAYTTSSATFGASTTPTDTVTVAGTFSGSGVATFGTSLSSSGDVAISGAYHGDGQYLANISADGVDVTSSTADINYPMVFTEGFQTDGSLGLAGNTGLVYNPNDNLLSSSAAFQILGDTTIEAALNVSGTTTFGSTSVVINGNAGTFSGSGGMEVVGATLLGSTLAVSGAVTLVATGSFSSISMSGSLSGSHTAVFGSSVSSSGDVAVTGNIHATQFYGGGTGITGISADGVDVTSSTADINYPMVFTEGFQTDGSLGLAGNTAFIYNPSDNILSSSAALQVVGNSIIGGTLNVSGNVGIGTDAPSAGATLEVAGTTAVPNPAVRITGTGPKLQFDENDAGAGKFQIAASNGMLKWQVQNAAFNDASVKWMMNSDGQMAFRDGAAGEAIPARIYISGSGDSNLLQLSSSAAADILVVTGSGMIGLGTADPSHTLTIVGDVSGSGILQVVGATTLGSTLSVSGSQTLAGAISSSAGSVFVNSISSSNDLAVTGNVHAAQFYGGGAGITGISADAIDVTSSTGDLNYPVVFTEGFQTDGTLGLAGNTGLVYNPNDAILSSSAAIEVVGSAQFGSTLNVTGAVSGAVGFTGASWTSDGAVSSSAALYGTDLVLRTNAASNIASIYIEGTAGTEIIGQSGGAMNIRSDGGALNLLGGTGNELRFGSDNVDAKMVLDTDGNLGIGTVNPSDTLTVVGAMSGSSTLQAVGATVLGNTLSVSGSQTLAGAISSSAGAVFVQSISSSGDIAITGSYHGDGQYLANISADGVDVTSSTGDLNYPIVFTEGFQSDGTLGLGGNTALVYNPNIGGSGDGLLSSSAAIEVVGSAQFGSTLNVTGAVSGAAGFTGASWTSDGAISGSSTLEVSNNTSLGAHLLVSGGVAGSADWRGIGVGLSARIVAEGDSEGPKLMVVGDQDNSNLTVFRFENTFGPTRGAELTLKKASRWAASPGILANGWRIGSLDWQGHDGSDFVEAASIVSDVDGTVGTGQMPANLLFNTADSAGTLTERLRITSGGFISGSGTLHTVGATTLGSTLNVTGAISGTVGVTGSSGIFDVQVSSSAFHGNTAYFSSDVQIAGTLIGGSPLKISGALDIVDDLGNVISGLGISTFSSSAGATFGSSISSSSDIAVSGNLHAATYYGDGSNLTGIDSASGSARQYSSTGMETSGYLKVSGSATFAAGITHNRAAITAASYTILVTDYYIGADTTSNAITLTLPAAATAGGGKTYIIKDEGGDASTNNITIDGDGSETVDGVTTVDITSPYGALNLYSDGSNWFVY